jgi:hypothetical protein
MDVDTKELVWDGFPDGEFSHLFAYDEAKRLQNLMVHWPYKVLGGKPGQSLESESWQGGKTTRRQCLGTIECDNDSCVIIVRPQTTTTGVRNQLSNDCKCGGALSHTPCAVISTLYNFKHGIHYVNGGCHDHSRPTHRLHLSATERAKFKDIVDAHPRNGPLKLLVGVPGVHGPGTSVADISPVLLNTGRIKHEKKVAHGKQNRKGADGAIAEFAAFEKAHPGFIRKAIFGAVTVITMQTPFMSAQLVKAHPIENEPVNGIVSDATHSFFSAPQALLFLSSAFSGFSRKWIPGLVSYSNGASAEHYRAHFRELISSIAEECASRNIPFTNEMLANV